MSTSTKPLFRDELPAYFTSLGLAGWGVEVGTYEGAYARHLLSTWGGRLHCVDPFVHQPGWRDILNHNDLEFEAIAATAKRNLRPWLTNGRCILHEIPSLEASKLWWAHDLDFVYLDARHDYESVLADLHAWWPLIVPGGVFCGHDYLNTTIGDTVFGVKRAVKGWSAGLGLESEIGVTEDGQYPSWYLRKPE